MPASRGIYSVLPFRTDDKIGSESYTLTLNGGDDMVPSTDAASNGQQPCDAESPQQSDPNDPGSTQPQVGLPINVATGNMNECAHDYTTAGVNPLAFLRFYNSLAAINSQPIASSLGVNWRSSFDRYLSLASSSTVLAERPDGRVVAFASSGSSWKTSPDQDMTLTTSDALCPGASWVLTDSEDTKECYSTSGAVALLEAIHWRNGYTQTLSYSGGLLSKVTDSYAARPHLRLYRTVAAFGDDP